MQSRLRGGEPRLIQIKMQIKIYIVSTWNRTKNKGIQGVNSMLAKVKHQASPVSTWLHQSSLSSTELHHSSPSTTSFHLVPLGPLELH